MREREPSITPYLLDGAQRRLLGPFSARRGPCVVDLDCPPGFSTKFCDFVEFCFDQATLTEKG